MTGAGLVPELICSNLVRSLAFYRDVLGFTIAFERAEERFAYVVREGAEMMLQEEHGSRSLLQGDLSHPYGRGLNLQIEVDDIATLLRSVHEAQVALYLPLEDRWYRRDGVEVGNRQFMVADPDGYLLRFFQDLG
jgi:catechol 2,3-dioxygenase-like lactoylglutathione lyase family enzyme